MKKVLKDSIIFKHIVFINIKYKYRNFFITASDLSGNVILGMSCGYLKVAKLRRERSSFDSVISLGRKFGIELLNRGIKEANMCFVGNFKTSRIDCILYGLTATGFKLRKTFPKLRKSHNGIKNCKYRRR